MLPLDTILKDHGAESACLVSLLRRRLGCSGEVGSFPLPTPPDPQHLMDLMIRHEVVPLATRPGDLEGVDVEAMDGLLASLRLRTAWNLVLFREMKSLSQWFEELGIEVLFYKGLVLCDLLHGDLTTRPTRDIDILVRARDFLRVRDRLLEAGFTEDYPFPLSNARYFMGVNRESAYSRMLPEGMELNVEVQWAPVLPFYSVPFDNDPLFLSASIAEFGGVRVPVPSLEVQFLLLLAHHGVSELWHSLKHLTDMAFFIQNKGGEMDWDEVSEGIRKWGMSGNAAVGFGLCRALLGTEIPAGLPVCRDEALLRRMRMRLLSEEPTSRSQILPANMFLQWRLTEGFIGKTRLLLGYLRKWVSPSLHDLNALRLPPVLFPLYYLIKPFRFLFAPRS